MRGRVKKARFYWVAVLAAWLLAACAVPPARYYSLSAAPQARLGQDAAPQPDASGYGLRLVVSRIPAQVDRPQLVVQDQADSPAVQVLNDSLWVAPLGEQVQGRLALAVAAALGVPDLAHLSGLRMIPARRIDVRLDRFDLFWGRAAVLDASWTDRAPGAAGVARICRANLMVPVATGGVETLVEAQRRALQMLAKLIADGGDRAGVPPLGSVLDSGCSPA